jgi:hypothetical protein
MTDKLKNKIEEISKEFTKGLGIDIKGSGFLVVDPLSAYLSMLGYENKLEQLPEKGERPLVLIMVFKDGTKFIPSGSDIDHEGAKDWLWLDKS